MTDKIADMLTRIRNASLVRKASVAMPYSRLKHELARVLKEEGYVTDVKVDQEGVNKQLVVVLRYHHDGSPAIRVIKRISRPGCRIYSKVGQLPVVMNTMGLAIISTSQGIMTNNTAKLKNLGGEVLAEIS